MVDEKTDGQGAELGAAESATGARKNESSFGKNSLEGFIAARGPMRWKECLQQFHDVCYALEGTADGARGKVNMNAFTVRMIGDGNDYAVEFSPKSDETANATGNGASHGKFPDEAYMSPEQCLDQKLDVRSDIYSLGCVMYHCLTGSPPFVIRDGERLKELQTIDYPLNPGRRSQRLHIPDEVDLLIQTCMAKDPAKRFSTANALRANIGKNLQLNEDDDDDSRLDAVTMTKRQRIFFTVCFIVGGLIVLAGLSYQMATSETFAQLITRTKERGRNRYFLSLESGQQYLNQMDFKDGKMKPEKDPVELKQKGQDIVLFATTQRDTDADALQEAVRRKLLLSSVDLGGKDLKNCKLNNAILPHAYMKDSMLDGSDLSGATLEQSYLNGASLKKCVLVGTNFIQSSLYQANLEGSNLSKAVLIGCDLSYANFKNTNLDNATLTGSNLDHLDLSGASMKGAIVSESMTHLVVLTDEQRKQIVIQPDAPPAGYTHP